MRRQERVGLRWMLNCCMYRQVYCDFAARYVHAGLQGRDGGHAEQASPRQLGGDAKGHFYPIVCCLGRDLKKDDSA